MEAFLKAWIPFVLRQRGVYPKNFFSDAMYGRTVTHVCEARALRDYVDAAVADVVRYFHSGKLSRVAVVLWTESGTAMAERHEIQFDSVAAQDDMDERLLQPMLVKLLAKISFAECKLPSLHSAVAAVGDVTWSIEFAPALDALCGGRDDIRAARQAQCQFEWIESSSSSSSSKLEQRDCRAEKPFHFFLYTRS
jgi:hypothetical protein